VEQETEQERLHRELIELLNELRVVLPGVQVLFAFLLTIPFSRGFPSLDSLERHVYFAALVFAVVSSIFLIAPSAYHRVLFRRGDLAYVIQHATRLALLGAAALALSIACAVFVVTQVVFNNAAAAVVGGAVAILSLTMWFGLPFLRRMKLERERGARGSSGR
jgi:hypothetical protein